MRKIGINLVLAVISLISIAPFYILMMMTTQRSEDIFKGEMFGPGDYLWENLLTVLRSNFLRSFWNSTYIAIATTVICVFICALAGFALTKYEFRGKKAVLAFIIATLMVPGQIGLVGFLIEMRALHLSQTHLPLILAGATNAFGVFWMVQFMKTYLHTELIESARMDGCSEFRIFMQIVLPVITPAISTLSLLVFLGSWNNYLLPLVLINQESLFTIPLSINSLGNLYRTDYGARLTGLLIAIAPLIVIFVLGTKSFIRGITAGAVKG
ncbi:carbohydrate ABC transporter permease [Paenibacillus methanolicus]|uniref:Multiple sugar transport system permease protein/cellobiose transport system permease protein n=1 Tax=Paenibacillus methanolicus TaxID=582686 RepID=A0A5S5CI19_9BACL|nr:carbohydrate ABC transporter permease [Paenibacillus methanolicus]TYP79372.1 multiple sugar transport system permease protein/cellobiose transport system permease protein [Paenibacillus methanolicus]